MPQGAVRTASLRRFGESLREAMLDSGWTIERMAKVLDVNASTVAKWRDGTRMPRLDVAIRLAHLLNVSLDELWGTELDSPN
jgi:transcriptional regulator with XRE-family HTH domain